MPRHQGIVVTVRAESDDRELGWIKVAGFSQDRHSVPRFAIRRHHLCSQRTKIIELVRVLRQGIVHNHAPVFGDLLKYNQDRSIRHL
jgi:hypothetical protein